MQSTAPPRTRDLTIAHPTDLSDADAPAFSLAVALALTSQSKLVSVHAHQGGGGLAEMPVAAHTLARWQKLKPDAREGDERALGMHHERVLATCCDDPVDTLLTTLAELSPDLLVAATSGREGLARMFFGSVAEALARQVRAPSLLLPVRAHTFISEHHGEPHLKRVLVAAGDAEATLAGLSHAFWLADVAGVSELFVELVHIGSSDSLPPLHLPTRAATRVEQRFVQGPLERVLLDEARAGDVQLMVMATRGHDSVWDVATNTHTERVLHRAPCPVLVVPLRRSAHGSSGVSHA